MSNRDKSLDDPRKVYKKKGVELGKKRKKESKSRQRGRRAEKEVEMGRNAH